MLNELFLKAHKLKHQIDQDINSYTSSKYSIPSDSDYHQLFRQHQAQLELKKLELNKQAENLNALLQAIQSEQLSVAQKMKLTNLKQNSKEIEMQIQQIYKQKQQKVLPSFTQLKEERDQISILGGNRTSTQSDTVGLLVDQQNSLTNSHKLVEESMQMGEDVLLSFKRQNDNLRNIQSKVNGIIGDMGFSQGIIKLIGSRDGQDRRILIILTTLLIVFIGLLYYVFK